MENVQEISHGDGFFQLNLNIKLNPFHEEFTPRLKTKENKKIGQTGKKKVEENEKNVETEISRESEVTDNGAFTKLKNVFQHHKENPQDYFQMTKSPKGKMIIINNDRFHEMDKPRSGSEEDVQNLQNTFSLFHGKIAAVDFTIVRNVTSRRILNILRHFAMPGEDPSFYAVVLMSHGTCQSSGGGLIDMIYGSDNTHIPVREVIEIFKQDHLKEIPVLMFFQMCRVSMEERAALRDVENANEIDAIPFVDGHRYNVQRSEQDLRKSLRNLLSNVLPGVQFITQGDEAEDETEASPVRRSSDNETDEPALEHASGTKNMLISFSTSEGYVSKRNKITGTWYIRALCEELRKNADTKDIIEIMKEVHQKVHETRGEGIACDTGHTLKKKLYFFPALP